jgi:hypothetical protein
MKPDDGRVPIEHTEFWKVELAENDHTKGFVVLQREGTDTLSLLWVEPFWGLYPWKEVGIQSF